jgi:hypothetical protein
MRIARRLGPGGSTEGASVDPRAVVSALTGNASPWAERSWKPGTRKSAATRFLKNVLRREGARPVEIPSKALTAAVAEMKACVIAAQYHGDDPEDFASDQRVSADHVRVFADEFADEYIEVRDEVMVQPLIRIVERTRMEWSRPALTDEDRDDLADEMLARLKYSASRQSVDRNGRPIYLRGVLLALLKSGCKHRSKRVR